jgi:thiosulfate/3-mercaptopyruvate sulfurtransferase
MEFPTPLISVAELADLLETDGADLVIADCRFNLADPAEGRRLYEQGHLPGAVYFDLDRDLSGPAREHGGRHPLPEPEVLAAALGARGIGPETRVVAYDDRSFYAARLWWLLRWLGHDQVAVLDGGYSAWVAAGLPVTQAEPEPVPHTFVPRPRPEMVADMAAVRDRPAGTVLIDARSPERFAGQPDPKDARPGHIPGAINRFWQGAYDEGGFFRTAAEQLARFAGLPDGHQLIHYCGSGVSACVNLLAMAIAGREGGRLYVGSASDWCSYPENPVENSFQR